MIIIAEIRVVLKMCVLSYICSSCCDDDFDDTSVVSLKRVLHCIFPSLCNVFVCVLVKKHNEQSAKE